MPSVKIKTSEHVSIRPGIHMGPIEDAVDAVSGAGNEMLKLRVKVGGLTFTTWVVFTTNNSKNLAEFAVAIGKKAVEDKVLTIEAEDCIGKSAMVKLGDSNKINPKTQEPFLEIKGWLPPVTESTDTTGDEIPF